jgi:hypothetical protein
MGFDTVPVTPGDPIPRFDQSVRLKISLSGALSWKARPTIGFVRCGQFNLNSFPIALISAGLMSRAWATVTE